MRQRRGVPNRCLILPPKCRSCRRAFRPFDDSHCLQTETRDSGLRMKSPRTANGHRSRDSRRPAGICGTDSHSRNKSRPYHFQRLSHGSRSLPCDGPWRPVSRHNGFAHDLCWNSGDKPIRQTALLSGLPAVRASAGTAGRQSVGSLAPSGRRVHKTQGLETEQDFVLRESQKGSLLPLLTI
jgi:hypothetical protein